MNEAESEPIACIHCDAALRDDARFCDRCGFAQAPRPPVPASPAWGLVAVLTFVVGLLAGGVLGYMLRAYRGAEAAPRDASRRAESPPAPIAPLAPEAAGTPKGPDPDAAANRLALTPDVPPPAAAAPVESDGPPGPADTSPEGLEAADRPAILELHAFDDDGKALPRAPAVVLDRSLALAPYGAIEDAATIQLVAETPDGRVIRHPVAGVVRHDPLLDLVLLEIVGELPDVRLAPRAAHVVRTEPAILLSTRNDAGLAPMLLDVGPGGVDPITKGPRLALARVPPFPGVLLDEHGALLALVPGQDGGAIPVAATDGWVAHAGPAVALDLFRRTLAVPSPLSRVREAQKAMARRRFDEAARLFLELLSAEPALLGKVQDDLIESTLEAAREHIGAGRGAAANALLTSTLGVTPGVAELEAARGRALALVGDVRGGVLALLRAAELRQVGASGYRMEARGILLDAVNSIRARGRPADALALLLDLMREFPDDGRLRQSAGHLAMDLRRFADAGQLFAAAAALDASIAGECQALAERSRDLAGGPGAIAIDYAPGGAVNVVAVLDRSSTATLRIDPSEPDTVVSRRAIAAAGYSLAALPRVRSRTDPSADEVPTVRIATVTVSGVPVDGIQALVLDGFGGPGIEGVLGKNYLARFRVVDDRSLGRMVLYPR